MVLIENICKWILIQLAFKKVTNKVNLFCEIQCISIGLITGLTLLKSMMHLLYDSSKSYLSIIMFAILYPKYTLVKF